MMKFNGIGLQEAKKQRKSWGPEYRGPRGGMLPEEKTPPEFLVYFGRLHLADFQTGVTSKGTMKIGRGKYKTAIMRGRNQPGGDFRIYAEILVGRDPDTYKGEKILKEVFKDRNVSGPQGQEELYDFSDEELVDTVYTVEELMIEAGCDVKEVNFY